MLQLKINGSLFGGWNEAVITRGIAQLASTFELKLTDRWDGVEWDIKPFDACQILWNSVPIITGYIDSNAIKYDADTHEITITGRSKTSDLVDCSAASGQFKSQTFQQIAAALCLPFSINVVAEADTGSQFLSWKPEDGVQVFEALEKLARLRGLLLMDNGTGDLVITTAGTKQSGSGLELGVNIKSATGTATVKDRFSEYTVKGQQKGGDNIDPKFAAHVLAKSVDSSVPRYRPLIMQAEDQADTATAEKRALWEKNVRFGLSQSFTYTVQGWEHKTGLWQPNHLVHVKDNIMGLDTVLLISSVTYSLSESGTIAQLSLSHPLAFLAEPIPPKPVKSSGSSSAKKQTSTKFWEELN